jgi:cell division septation protein DedD
MARTPKAARPKAKTEAGEPGWGRGFAKGVAAVAGVIVFSVVVVYAYNKGKEAGGGSTPPIIKAGPAPYKVRPEQPGGMKVLNRDKQIYSEMEDGPKEPVVERLLPPAEAPIITTAEASAATPPAVEPKSVPAETDPPPAVAAAKPDPTPQPPPPQQNPPSPPKPTAKPPVETVTKPTARQLSKIVPASNGGYRIQLASLRSNAAAARSWKKLVDSHKELLGGLRLTIARRDLGAGKGVFFRVQAGPLKDQAAARSLCDKLKRRKISCLVVRP